jgi:hypothetical protein
MSAPSQLNSEFHRLERTCYGDAGIRACRSGNDYRRKRLNFPTESGVEPLRKIRHPSSREGVMDRDREQVRLELAQLVNDQADAMEKRTLTATERREREKRLKWINELCDELRRIAPADSACGINRRAAPYTKAGLIFSKT